MTAAETPEFDLLEHGLTHARECLEALTKPNDDILPVLMWLGPYGMGVMPLLDMTDEKHKDDLAEMMTTSLACSRATEAVMITTSWMVKAVDPGGDGALLNCMPSEHPDRVEAITAMYVTHESNKDAMASAPVIRAPRTKPQLGEWSRDMADMRVGGRFGDAIHMGMDFAANMPDELIAILDEGWRDGEQEDLIKRFHKVFRTFIKSMDAFKEGMAKAEGA